MNIKIISQGLVWFCTMWFIQIKEKKVSKKVLPYMWAKSGVKADTKTYKIVQIHIN